jgi:hypothetical protein
VITPNDPVEFKPSDPTIMASVAPHAFEMPSIFTMGNVLEERAMRNSEYVYPINLDLVERFRTIEYRTAMIRELIQYYAMYKRDGLKSLGEYSLTTTYTEQHETLDVIFDRHVELTGNDKHVLKICEIHDRIVHEDRWEGSKKKLRIYANNCFKRSRSTHFITTANRPALRGAQLRQIMIVGFGDQFK